MASCLFVTATLMLTLSFIAAGIAFFGPYWMSIPPKVPNVGRRVEHGLWARCDGGVCAWIWENDFTASKDGTFFSEEWYIAAQALFGVGFLMVFATEIYSRCQFCCDGRPGLARSAGTLLIVASLMMAAGVGVFGGFLKKETPDAKLEWGFWCGVVASGLSLCTGLLLIFVAGCNKKYNH